MPPDGVLLIAKPTGITSHTAVALVRRAIGIKKVGHSGTLDPMAEGLLVMGVGRGTRLLRFLSEFPKTYEGTARLGVQTDTLDADGAVTATAPVKVTEAQVREAFAALTGEIMQTPPAYSAVKVGGRPLYKEARAGRSVVAEPRPVRVDAFDLLALADEQAEFRVQCSSGTYVRSLVADAGRALGCGAHLTRLVRTRIGPFDLAEATSPEDPGEPLALDTAVAHLPSFTLEAEEVTSCRNGCILAPAGFQGPYAVREPDGSLIGIYQDDGAKGVPQVIVRPA
ncbi:MAG: tRNA pseudouridine(55) synthase TruB [Actinobacteria bacterium]|nr:tRNA pseudouridine(55) synthase TruB [Actinomycetota bacterium]